MTEIDSMIADYLRMRRTLGYKLADHGWLLDDFADFLKARGASTITTELALAWATEPQDALPSWWAARLRVVRGFACQLAAFDPATEIPPVGLLPSRNRRAVPYLYSETEVRALMAAAAALRPVFHALTYQTLIGLLVVTGMRLGEVIRLDSSDLDTAEAMMTIRDSKFAKSRQVPLHPSTMDALAGYADLRQRWCPRADSPSLLISTAGTRLIRQNVEFVFTRLVRQTDLRARPDGARPRLHDFRHALAVSTLLGWYRDGVDVQSQLPVLSTFLGHTKPANTYWYLSAVPELLALAAARRDHIPRADA